MKNAVATLRNIDLPQLIKGHFRRHGFLDNLTTVMSGNLVAQSVVFFTAPIITRLYSPEDYGIMSLVITYIAMLGVFSSLKYETSIVIEQEDHQAILSMALCLIISLSVFLLSYVLVMVWCVFGETGSIPEQLLFFIPFGALLYSIVNIHNTWNIRKKEFLLLSTSVAFAAVIGASTKLTAGYLIGSSASWLILGNLCGSLIAGVILNRLFFSRNRIYREVQIHWKDLRSLAAKHINFPKYEVATGFLVSLSQSLPILMFSWFFTPQIVGFYGLGLTVLHKPTQLFAQSFSKVFLQKASEVQHRQGNLRDYLLKSTLFLAAIGIIPFGTILIYGKELFSLVFGAKWEYAGWLSQLLAPWLYFGFMKTPSTQIMIVMKRLKFQFVYTFWTFIARAIAILSTAFIFKEIEITLVVFSFVGSASIIYYIFNAYKFNELK